MEELDASVVIDSQRKFKPHYREIERENRVMDRDKEKEIEYQRLLSDWEAKERDYEDSKNRDKQRQIRREQELKNMIDEDLKYDSSDDKNNSKHHKGKPLPKVDRFAEKRKQKRAREAERDQEDRLKEQEEIRIEEEKRQEEERKRQEEIRKAEERKRRPKSRFTEIKETKSETPKNDPAPYNPATFSIPPPQNNLEDDSEIVRSKDANKSGYYVPQNAPEGAIPLRIPGQSVGK